MKISCQSEESPLSKTSFPLVQPSLFFKKNISSPPLLQNQRNPTPIPPPLEMGRGSSNYVTTIQTMESELQRGVNFFENNQRES